MSVNKLSMTKIFRQLSTGAFIGLLVIGVVLAFYESLALDTVLTQVVNQDATNVQFDNHIQV